MKLKKQEQNDGKMRFPLFLAKEIIHMGFDFECFRFHDHFDVIGKAKK